MKIYTRTGDGGNTSLSGGTRVPKNDHRVEATGTMDELNSWLGLLGAQDIDPHDRDVLLRIQKMLMLLSSHLADEKKSMKKLPLPGEDELEWMESEIDRLAEKVPAQRSFIIPGGHIIVSYAHVSRTVCRRAERRLVPVLEKDQEVIMVMKLLNRLSDYLYMLCRKLSMDLNCEEKIWNPLP